MAENEKPPRSAVVIYTAGGDRIKPPCPMCHHTYWGTLVPPHYIDGAKVSYSLLGSMDNQSVAMGIQVWVCLNCGFLWHRTGSVDQEPVKHEP